MLVAGKPVFVGRGGGPALLGLRFFYHVDVLEVLFPGVVGLHGRIGVDVADGAVVVGADFQPVVHAPHDQLRGKYVGEGAVVKDDVHEAEVLYVGVGGAEVSLVVKAF